MSINIRIMIYDKNVLFQELQKWGADDVTLTMQILEKCGSFFGDTYVLLNNELADDLNPYWNIAYLFDAAFNNKDSFDIFLQCHKDGISYVNEWEVASELNIKMRDEEE